MSTHPPLCRILEYLDQVSHRVQSSMVREAVQDLAARTQVPADGGASSGPAGGVREEDKVLLAVEEPRAAESKAPATVKRERAARTGVVGKKEERARQAKKVKVA